MQLIYCPIRMVKDNIKPNCDFPGFFFTLRVYAYTEEQMV